MKSACFLAVIGIFAGAACPARAQSTHQARKNADIKFFESNIRPVLADRCFSCHGPEKQKSKLRLDSLEAILKGGRAGPAIKPGQPEDSLLIRAIRHGEEPRMPPKAKLPAREIADLTAWVKMGAPWPNASVKTVKTDPTEERKFTKEQLSFWAFRAPVAGPLPTVQNPSWIQSPIDRFILAELEKHGLQPAAPADRRTLLRRASFDLIGLPPTPSEIAAFLADNRPDAFARVVERLLASPHYGERWGRHWLDVARYADSNGMDENLTYGNAFRYRDYVVNAFNQDKPYDQFVREQLAGDLLPAANPAARNEQIIATGFLVIGPKMLAEDDPVKMEMDIIDEQVDTLGRTFMGMTLGCARCHDHKYDPISSADYYALAGIFKSSKTMDNFRVVARWHEHTLASPAEVKRKQELDRAIAQKEKMIYEKNGKTVRSAEELRQLKLELLRLEETAPKLPEAMGVTEGTIGNLRIHRRGSHLTLGKEAPRRFPAIFAGVKQEPISAKHSGRLELARWLTDPGHPLTSRVMVNRIWQGHFGAGLVRSPDHFGLLGDRPTNQRLLDCLALRFVDQGWSIKAMHRLIMLSSTYQMGSAFDDKAALADADNRLHWRMNRRRLEAEALRDALLAISGQLDRTMRGTIFEASNRAYVPGYPNANYEKYDSRRRSIYLPVIRSALYDVFQAFDFPDPSVANGQRTTTTVTPQALFMMNSMLMHEQTRALAGGLLEQEKLDDAGRLALAYEKIYARPATKAEMTRDLDFLRRIEAALPENTERRLRSWQSLCRVLLAANEFVYVE